QGNLAGRPDVEHPASLLHSTDWPSPHHASAARDQFVAVGLKQYRVGLALGQMRRLPAAGQVPESHAVVHAHGEEAAGRADVQTAILALSRAEAADERSILQAGGDFHQPHLRALLGVTERPGVAVETL